MRSCWWRAGATGSKPKRGNHRDWRAKALVVPLDLCEPEPATLEQALREAELTVEILVNNAGLWLDGLHHGAEIWRSSLGWSISMFAR